MAAPYAARQALSLTARTLRTRAASPTAFAAAGGSGKRSLHSVVSLASTSTRPRATTPRSVAAAWQLTGASTRSSPAPLLTELG